MRQRLGIAAALLRDPKLLLLDEPATGLDPAGMRDMRLLIRRLADQGMTVLLSSHLLAEVEELCNRVAIVRTGKIVYEGAIADSQARRRRRRTGCRATDDERALAVCRRPAGHRRRRASMHGRISFTADEPAVAELSQALIEAGALIQVARAADGDARGPVLLADRGRRRRRRRRRGGRSRRRRRRRDELGRRHRGLAGPAPARSDARVATGRRDRVPVGAVQAPLPEADLPRARGGGDRPDPVRASRSTSATTATTAATSRSRRI